MGRVGSGSFLLHSRGMSQVEQPESTSKIDSDANQAFGFSGRLEFLCRAVNDSQETIRFLDAKAGFCVTLLTAMMVAAFGPVAQARPTTCSVYTPSPLDSSW